MGSEDILDLNNINIEMKINNMTLDYNVPPDLSYCIYNRVRCC